MCRALCPALGLCRAVWCSVADIWVAANVHGERFGSVQHPVLAPDSDVYVFPLPERRKRVDGALLVSNPVDHPVPSQGQPPQPLPSPPRANSITSFFNTKGCKTGSPGLLELDSAGGRAGSAAFFFFKRALDPSRSGAREAEWKPLAVVPAAIEFAPTCTLVVVVLKHQYQYSRRSSAAYSTQYVYLQINCNNGALGSTA